MGTEEVALDPSHRLVFIPVGLFRSCVNFHFSFRTFVHQERRMHLIHSYVTRCLEQKKMSGIPARVPRVTQKRIFVSFRAPFDFPFMRSPLRVRSRLILSLITAISDPDQPGGHGHRCIQKIQMIQEMKFRSIPISLDHRLTSNALPSESK